MAASDHLQLRMFMSARDIGDYVDAYGDVGDNTGGLPHEAMRAANPGAVERKINNMGGSGMGDSIAAEGVKKPLDITHRGAERHLVNGHHRLIAQSQADPDRLMPVVHTERWEGDYHGRTPSGFRREGLTYDAFNMYGSQQSDPTGDAPRRMS